MELKTIIGRNQEIARLDECMESSFAQLIIVYGRRRIGKTFLINEYYKNNFAFKLTGTFGGKKEIQLRNFLAELNRKSKKQYDIPKDWIEAFEFLREYLEKAPKNKKQIVFFDEMPWLDTQKSGFLSAFEWFWNDWGATKKNLVFIVCGSATSWMDEKIANNKGGLFNRQTCKLYLKPFKLYEVKEFLESKKIYWSNYDIAQCYMILGGIPYYLNLLSNNLSLSQNIDKLIFFDGGELWDEFEHLYRTLFLNSDNYVKVVQALSTKKGGFTREQIAKSAKLTPNGDLTKILNDLALSGFVRVSQFYNKKKKETLYQLSDYYTAFYFKYIKDNYRKDKHFWNNMLDNPSRATWEGLVFEQVCKDHVDEIKQRLGISGVLTETSSWFTKGNKELGTTGAQIDLLIDRRDNVVSICEIKFSKEEFLINKDYDLKLRNKIGAFKEETNFKKSIQLVMITTFGVKKNKYSSIVQNQVVLDDLFKK